MIISVPRLAATLRWLAVVWIVVWAVYAAYSDGGRLTTVDGMATALAVLLIPAGVAWALSSVLDVSNIDHS